MKLTETTREVLRCRRVRRDLAAAGYEEVDERGGKLWQLHRGGRTRHTIVHSIVGPEGNTVFIKVVPPEVDKAVARILAASI